MHQNLNLTTPVIVVIAFDLPSKVLVWLERKGFPARGVLLATIKRWDWLGKSLVQSQNGGRTSRAEQKKIYISKTVCDRASVLRQIYELQ